VRIGSSSGSGVIVSEDGYVLTAGHVSGKPAQEAVFILHDGREVKGTTLGANHDIDSGMMKITEPGKWPFIPISPMVGAKPGQWCISTGHPGGYIEGRQPVVRLGRILFTNDKVLCTDCTLVGGDSGGPLFDMDGQIIGIHSRIGWQTTTNFHVPIATYRDTWDRLAKSEMWGVPLEDSSDASVQPVLGVAGEPKGETCRVTQVFPGSAAARAGIQVGDVIRKFNDEPVAEFEQLARLVRKREPGDKVKIELVRGEQTMTLDVTLGGIHGKLPGGLPQDDDE
jgi:serine protease Do